MELEKSYDANGVTLDGYGQNQSLNNQIFKWTYVHNPYDVLFPDR